MRLPTFILVGVQKAATTSLYRYLSQHPQIYTSPVKEPNFLEREWEQAAPQGSRHRDRIDTWDKYCQLFAGVTDEIAIGEASTNCLFHHSTSVPQIQRYLPGAQIVIMLRDPADRARSDYLMHIRDAIYGGPQESLSDHLRLRAKHSYIVRKGYYFEGVRHFITAFGRERVKVMFYDDLQRSPGELMQDLYGFLRVDASFQPDMGTRSQTAQLPKNQWFNRLLRQPNSLRSTVAAGLKLIMPASLRQGLRQRLISLNSNDASALTLAPDDRQALIQLYREDILQLQGLLQRDLSSWLR